jgi:ABC-type transporter Mla MlaB component
MKQRTAAVDLVEDDGQSTLRLRGDVGAQCSSELERAARALSRRQGDVVVECKDAARLDPSALRFLTSLERDLAGQQRRLHLTSVPERLRTLVLLAGLAPGK